MSVRGRLNGVKTVGLLTILWGLTAAIGAVLSFASRSTGPLLLFAVIGLAGTFVAYFRSDTIAIKAMGAVPVSEAEAPVMHRIVRELAQEAGEPMPRLYVSPEASPNAFATGRNPRNAVVCCTSGILRVLDERELRGVLAHELMHVYNRDILIASVAAAAAGLITSAGQLLLFSGSGRRGNPLVLVGMLVMALLAPIGAALVRMAITRTREYEADSGGATLAQDPLALADALRKITAGAQARPLEPARGVINVAPMMIANPFRSGRFARMFATHPPIEERIERLETMAMR